MYDASVDDDADERGLDGQTDIGDSQATITQLQAAVAAAKAALAKALAHPNYGGPININQLKQNLRQAELALANALAHRGSINGDDDMMGNVEIGDGEDDIGNVEIGAAEHAAVVEKVIEKARDNRAPAPPMKAVAVDAPEPDTDVEDWLTDVSIGAAVQTGKDQFPLTTAFLQRFGAGADSVRIVRVDTEESYKAFRAAASPEMAEMSDRISDLHEKVRDHLSDPDAHGSPDEALAEDFEDIEVGIGQAASADAAKKIDLQLPAWAKGRVKAWREGDCVCVTVNLPGSDGETRFCTSVEPLAKCIEEAARHAVEADVPAAVIGAMAPTITAMGCVLGAGTVVKAITSGAGAILSNPKADKCLPFMVRLEPKASPALAALCALLCECKSGNQAACAEWKALADAAKGGGAGPVAQAMGEAMALMSNPQKLLAAKAAA